jgi:hypothetical protein
MGAWAWILIAIGIVAVVALIVLGAAKRRTASLRQRFGPEYDRTVTAREDRRAAEAELRSREQQRAKLDIRPLPEAKRAVFAEEWRGVQERFVDQPAQAVMAADTLVGRVMAERGYPMGDFEAQAGLVSVDHPRVVEDYRFAHGVRERSRTQQASTEDLREAMLKYRSLFDDLLVAGGGGTAAEAAPDTEAVSDAEAASHTAAPPGAVAMAEPGRTGTAGVPADQAGTGAGEVPAGSDAGVTEPGYRNQPMGRGEQ